MRISKRTVDVATPTTRAYFLWDKDLRGFGVKVTPAGSKVYLLQYRMGGREARTQRYTIGKHGSPWEPASARAEAQRLLIQVRSGVDPRAAVIKQQRDRQELRFDKYAAFFIERYAKSNWRARTLLTHESNLQRWVVPVLGTKALTELKRQNITAVLDRVPASSPALPRNLFALMRRIFTWAVERGDLERSPMAGMKVPSNVAPRRRVLRDAEIITIAACADRAGPIWESFFRMLIITGQRRTEVAGLRWEELDRAERVWVLPADRAKNKREHTVPLSTLALGELDTFVGSRRWPKTGFVYSHTGATPISGFSKTKRRLDKAITALAPHVVKPWRPHDIRRSVATNLQRLGVRFEVIEAILNHVSIAQVGSAAPYHHYDWDLEKRVALQQWADELLKWLNAPPAELKNVLEGSAG